MDKKKWDVFVYGDVNIDLIIPGVTKFPEPGQEDETEVMETAVGGGAALFALGLGKLGLHPVFQGSVGNDLYGRFIQEEFNRRNVDTPLPAVSRTQKTGISISFTNEKDRSFLTLRGTNESLDISGIRLDAAAEAGHIHLTGYAGSRNHDTYRTLLREIREKTDATVSFDLGWDSAGEWKKEIYELFPLVDVLFMNETEAIHYSRMKTAQEAGQDFARYCRVAVIKLGAKGSVAFSEGKCYQKDRYRVTAVDTTGAGDSFNAGFIYGYLTGRSIPECLSCGNGCGALSVTGLGGNTGFPDVEKLREFIRQQENCQGR